MRDFNEIKENLKDINIRGANLDEVTNVKMIEYVTNDIQNIDKELLRIKKHILAMKEKLTKNQI